MKKFMKKMLLPLMLVLLVSLVFTGCTDDKDNTDETQSEDKDLEDKVDDTIKDTEDEVRDVNYEDIKVTPEEAFDKVMELHPDSKVNKFDLDKGLMEYEYIIEGYDDENDYEVKVNPVDGEIISDDVEELSSDNQNDENIEITKDHLAKVDSIIKKAKVEDASKSELDEWNIYSEDGKVVIDVEIGLMKYSYDMESEELTNSEENEKDNDNNAFTDIDDKDEETQDAINNLISKGIMQGKSDSEFKPDEPMTRADVAMAMVKGFYELDEDAKASFTDVKEDDEYYKYIATSEKENIIMGYPDDSFKGSQTVTKEGLISISSRALHERKDVAYPEDPKETIKFEDKDDILDYAIKEIALAANEDLIDVTESKLEPQGKVTRAEAAVIINRLINKLK